MGQIFHRQCERVVFPKAKKSKFDLHASGDFPLVLFKMKSKAWVIRTPTVGMCIAVPNDSSLYEIKVAPDFISYLSSLLEGESHLYINLMGRQLKSEATLSKVIEELEKEFKEKIQVVTLDKNSSFYYQDDEYENMDYALDFKHNFSQVMFNHSGSSFYWSEALDLDIWKEECNQIMDDIHKTYFSDQPHLVKRERCAFIEIFYLKIIERLTEQLQTTRLNLSCRFCADRGGTALALLYLYELLQSQQTLTSEQIKKVYSLALGPSLINYHRATQKERIDQFLDTAQFLINPPTLEFQTFWKNKSNPFFFNSEDKTKISNPNHPK